LLIDLGVWSIFLQLLMLIGASMRFIAALLGAANVLMDARIKYF